MISVLSWFIIDDFGIQDLNGLVFGKDLTFWIKRFLEKPLIGVYSGT